ncbi:DNA-formamidopyrimidine glycosylase, partial [Patescibacteria group bacterium]|nr:DNA-formamidopyrimidine glycosylase [Patescibacteria group bacterium]
FVVYGRTGQSCPSCKGKIQRLVVGGRGTFWCPTCQQ